MDYTEDKPKGPIYWIGPLSDSCQLYGIPFGSTMYDANLPGIGWGNFCERAFIENRGRLGTGFGQKYEKQIDGRWMKVAG